MQSLDQARLTKIKASFATRRVDHGDIAWLDDEASDLKHGDLVVARVERIGQHQRIERPDGRRALLFPGDEILVACGARYAPDQFEADCPTGLGPANLVAAGGIAGLAQVKHDNMKSATEITILGAVCNRRGEPMNLADYAVSTEAWPVSVPVIAVCGTSMNAGKTHTVASLARGFAQSGQKVAAIKATGTGAGGDLWTFHDFGADHVRDFTDAGFATTYRIRSMRSSPGCAGWPPRPKPPAPRSLSSNWPTDCSRVKPRRCSSSTPSKTCSRASSSPPAMPWAVMPARPGSPEPA